MFLKNIQCVLISELLSIHTDTKLNKWKVKEKLHYTMKWLIQWKKLKLIENACFKFKKFKTYANLNAHEYKY